MMDRYAMRAARRRFDKSCLRDEWERVRSTDEILEQLARGSIDEIARRHGVKRCRVYECIRARKRA